MCSSASRSDWCIGGRLDGGADTFRGLYTIDISIEDTPSISPNVDTPVNAWITGDGVGTDRSKAMSGVVDLDPWKKFSYSILVDK